MRKNLGSDMFTVESQTHWYSIIFKKVRIKFMHNVTKHHKPITARLES